MLVLVSMWDDDTVTMAILRRQILLVCGVATQWSDNRAIRTGSVLGVLCLKHFLVFLLVGSLSLLSYLYQHTELCDTYSCNISDDLWIYTVTPCGS